jgi:hypothetical protein
VNGLTELNAGSMQGTAVREGFAAAVPWSGGARNSWEVDGACRTGVAGMGIGLDRWVGDCRGWYCGRHATLVCITVHSDGKCAH